MASIWITGARGFLGRHLARRLADSGHSVAGVGHGDWTPQEAASWGVSVWIPGELSLSNLATLRQHVGVPQYVYHFAGGASVGAALATPREDFGRTVVTTADLLEWLRLESPQSRLVAISSAAVYGHGHPERINESTPVAPCSPYGFHKLMMEELCRSYGTSFGTACVVVRLFSVYGAGLRKQLLWDVCNKLADGHETIELSGTGEELRDWIHVSDVARALELVRELASPQIPVLNVGSGSAASVRSVVESLSNAWGGATRRRADFNGHTRSGDPVSLVADSDRLRALGFDWRVSLTDGIAEYVAWHRTEREARRL